MNSKRQMHRRRTLREPRPSLLRSSFTVLAVAILCALAANAASRNLRPRRAPAKGMRRLATPIDQKSIGDELKKTWLAGLS